MASNKYYLVIAAILLILASACVYADKDDDARYKPEWGSEYWISGVVSDIDYGSEVFAIKDGNFKYTIIAEDTRFELRNGALGRLRDIKESMVVRISGERITSSQIAARTVIVLEDTGRFDNGRDTGAYYPYDQTQIEGYVTEVNTRANQIHVRANRENYVVDIGSRAEIRRSGYLTGINGIREEDQVTVTGSLRGRGRIDARYINIRGYDGDNYYDDRNNHRVGTVEGTITATTGYFDRSIAIRTSYGEVKVDVAKEADVRLDGRSVSIHNISKGAWARAYGEWDGSTLEASRVDAYSSGDGRDCPGGGYCPNDPRSNPPTYPQTRVGVITSIDTKKSIIKFDIGLADMTVNAANADITHQGSKISLSRLQKGDKIQVSGNYTADTLKARSIQVLKWAEEMGINDKW